MQIISTIALYNYKVPVIVKKNNFTFCRGKSRENSINIFQDLQTKFKDFPVQQKKSRTFSDVATLHIYLHQLFKYTTGKYKNLGDNEQDRTVIKVTYTLLIVDN